MKIYFFFPGSNDLLKIFPEELRIHVNARNRVVIISARSHCIDPLSSQLPPYKIPVLFRARTGLRFPIRAIDIFLHRNCCPCHWKILRIWRLFQNKVNSAPLQPAKQRASSSPPFPAIQQTLQMKGGPVFRIPGMNPEETPDRSREGYYPESPSRHLRTFSANGIAACAGLVEGSTTETRPGTSASLW